MKITNKVLIIVNVPVGIPIASHNTPDSATSSPLMLTAGYVVCGGKKVKMAKYLKKLQLRLCGTQYAGRIKYKMARYVN